MKTSTLLIIVLTVALCIVGFKFLTNKTTSSDMTPEQIVLENIASRASIRAYTSDTVEQTKIDQLLRAAMAAPSAVNKQPWHFIVVTDKELLSRLATAAPNARMAAQAPLAIVVCGDMDKTLEGEAKEYWTQDAAAATQNILLAAHAMGLGAVWTGFYPVMERCEKARQLLQIPDQYMPFCTIVIGYPDERPAAKNKFKTENISYNVFGGAPGEDLQLPAAPEKKFVALDVKKDFRVNPYTYFTGKGRLLCVGDKKKSNAMTIGWGGMGTIWRQPMLTVFVKDKRYTHEFMERAAYFTVMEFADEKILDYMGHTSGRDADKAKEMGLTLAYTENGTPYYEEAEMVIECKMMAKDNFNAKNFMDDAPFEFEDDKTRSSYFYYVGKVVNAWRKQ